MRTRSLLLVVALMVATTASAQPLELPEGPMRPFLNVQSALQKAYARKTADTGFLLAERLNHSRMGGEWELDDRETFHYDGQRRVEERYFTAGGGEPSLAFRVRMIYDGDLLTERIEEMYDAGSESFSPETRTLFFYLESPTRHVEIEQVYDAGSGQWQDLERFTSYFEEGETIDVIVEGTSDEWDGTDWIPAERFVIEETAGEGVTWTDQTWDGSEFVHLERMVFAEMSREEVTRRMVQAAEQIDTYGLMALVTLLPDAVYQEWNGSEWVNLSRQISEITYHYSLGEVWQRDVLSQAWEEGEWVDEMLYVVSYDADNNFVPDTLKMMVPVLEDEEASEPEWTTILHETYEHNEHQLLTDAYQTMESGGFAIELWTHLIWTGTSTTVDDVSVPKRFELSAAYPNPFNPSTTLNYTLRESGPITLRVYDIMGRIVATVFEGMQASGEHAARFEAGHLPSGVYLVRLEAPGTVQSQKVTLIK